MISWEILKMLGCGLAVLFAGFCVIVAIACCRMSGEWSRIEEREAAERGEAGICDEDVAL